MPTYKIDYDKKRNCFDDIKDVKADLIWGDTEYVKNPFISYIIPAYNRADLLSQTIDSLLNQREVDFEWDIVIVDNNPQQGNEIELLIKEINEPRILYYRNHENIGVDGNYNRCIELARGEWVAMIHADDLVMNDHLISMGRFLTDDSYKNKKKPLAYICQKYIDFSKGDDIELDRDKAISGKNKYYQDLQRVFNNGKLEKQLQSQMLFTGFYAALPSFGTIMKREIMIREGGFDKELGICEDVITPYRLAQNYGVYAAPNVMGFHRFDGSESMKTETIFKIYAAMIDFREYVYSRSVLSKIWGNICRDVFNRDLCNYCVAMSRFSIKRLYFSDFDYIYKIRDTGKFKIFLLKVIIGIYNLLHGLSGYDENIGRLIDQNEEKIKSAIDKGLPFIFYGIGTAAKSMIPILRKKYKGINIKCFIITEKKESSFMHLPVLSVEEALCYRDECVVVTATIIWEYQCEMTETLKKNKFSNIINLLDD